MKYLICLPFILMSLCVEAQDYLPNKDTNEVYLVVERVPLFPGGEKALISYISENLVYPSGAMKDSVSGLVIISFIVDTSGKVTDAEVIQGVRKDIDEEALRVVSGMPAWSPGVQKGNKVRVRLNLPIRFAIAESSHNK